MSLWIADELQQDKRLQCTAGTKARDDFARIAESLGARVLEIPLEAPERGSLGGLSKLVEHAKVAGRWASCLSSLESADVLFIQFPLVSHTIFFGRVARGCKRRGVKVVLLVHDLETLRAALREDTPLSRRARLDGYCSWLFPVLGRVEALVDFTGMTPFEARCVGRLSELLLDVWVARNGVEYVECPVVSMERVSWARKGSAFLAAKFLGRKYEGSF